MGKQRVILKHQRDTAFFGRHTGNVFPVQPNFAAVRPDDARNHIQQGGFAAARPPQYGEYFAAPDSQADVVGDRFAAEAFAESVQFKHGASYKRMPSSHSDSGWAASIRP